MRGLLISGMNRRAASANYTIPYQLSFQLGLGLNFQDIKGGGWMGECGITANLSPAELPAGAGTELGNII